MTNNNKFWLYYSLVMAVGFYPVVANAYRNNVPYIVLAYNRVCPTDLARSEGSCSGSDIDTSLPAYVYQIKNTGIGLDVFDDSCPPSGATYNSNVDVLAAPTYFCKSCPSGYDLVSLETLIGSDYIGQYSMTSNTTGLTAGTDFTWGTSGSLGEVIYNFCHNQGNTCYFHTGEWGGMDPQVCVKCERLTHKGNWSSYNTTNKSVRRQVSETNVCSVETTTVYEYACAANSRYISGSGENIKCGSCHASENCNPNDGHTSGVLSCKAGYYLDTSSGRCAECSDGYYQPSNSNKGGISSCIRCPKYEDKDVQGNDIYGTTDHMKDGAATWKDKCYVCDPGEDCEYLDSKGRYYYDESYCYWSGAAYTGS